MTKDLNIGLIGAGFIGRAHALAIRAAGQVFPDAALRPVAHMVVEATAERAEAAAQSLGFAHSSSEWEEAVEKSDAIIVAVPSFLHAPVVSRAISARKPVLCEKPVGLSAAEAAHLAAAAKAAGVTAAAGFTYARAPLVQHARNLLASGELGTIRHVRGRHSEDYLADPDAPFSWRLSAASAGPFGALGDLGYHIIGILRLLCGPVAGLSGLTKTIHPSRTDPETGAPRVVENEDYAAALLNFECGAVGVLHTSRIAQGRKMDIGFEIACDRGTLVWDGERMNELRLYEAGQPPIGQGFRTLLANAAHPGYAGFLPAPGHQLGFNDLKTIELNAFLTGIADGTPVHPDLEDAARVSRICDAILASSAAGRTIDNPETSESLP